MTRELFAVAGHAITARDLVLLGGGLFLLAKATFEIHHNLEGDQAHAAAGRAVSFAAVIAQIMVLDVIFSLDSVITAIGMADHLPVMVAAVVIAVLVGMSLVAESFGQHIAKGYIYFAMGCSVFVEMLNLRARARAGHKPIRLRRSPEVPEP